MMRPFQYKLGATIDKIVRPLDSAAIEALGKSAIETFEYTPVNFAGDYTGRLCSEARTMLQNTGKRFISCHVPYDQPYDVSDPSEEIRRGAVERLNRLFDQAYFFGCQWIVLHPSREIFQEEPREIRLRNIRRSVEQIAPALRSHNLQLALEWLPRSCMGNSSDELLAMLEGSDQTLVGVCLDVNHMMGHYRELPAIVERLGKHLFTLHISDYDGVDEKHWLPGAGVIDWGAFLNALRRVDYRGPFNYECGSLPGDSPAEKCRAIEHNFQAVFSAL